EVIVGGFLDIAVGEYRNNLKPMTVCACRDLNGVQFAAADIGVEAVTGCEVLHHSLGRLSRVRPWVF
ncbi:MAG: hypothetical protein ACPHNZ_11075, partial [Ilumatobacteraceae bacterium]